MNNYFLEALREEAAKNIQESVVKVSAIRHWALS